MCEEIKETNEISSAECEVAGLAKISKQVKESVVSIDKEQLKSLVDAYYQAQQDRKMKASQLRSFQQKVDIESEKVKKAEKEKNITALEWLYKDASNREAQIQAMLLEYCKHQPVCSWAMQIKGIGPVISAFLWAYLDIDKCPSVGAFHSYAGLNDNNNPWLGKEKGRVLTKEVYEELGYDKKHEADQRVLAAISEKTKDELIS